ncbi:unnamed protein product [Somion occarium]|uniref:Poly(A) RNA polymerase mitochondrial-like central palm domain-containing protein n=1 Tax=Somion occarium TaxID=3059160 RepID=A0ABP1DV37_9APHY
MRRWTHDVEGAPVELSIIDTKYPRGIPPEAVESAYSDAYNAAQVAVALQDSGFTNIRMQAIYPSTGPVPGPQFPGEIICSSEQPFVLSVPGPTLEPTVVLLQQYASVTHRLSQLFVILHLWARSHNLQDVFSPRILAFIAIHMFQRFARILEPLQGDTGTGTLKGSDVWVYGPFGPDDQPPTTAYQVDTRFRRATRRKEPLVQLVDLFFRRCHENYLRSNVLLIHGDQPHSRLRSWEEMVLPDPFIHNHNHAQTIPAESWARFSKLCDNARLVLAEQKPLTAIFGQHLPESYFQPGQPATPIQDLHTYIMTSYENTRPTRDVHKRRTDTITKVQRVIKENYEKRHKGYKVKVFGSSAIGLDSASSDLDLVVLDPARPDGFSPYEKNKSLAPIYAIKRLAKVLQKAGFRSIEARATATVPIVKFRDPDTKINCDLGVGERLGLLNTALIKHYCDMLPILRPFLYAIKSWAKPLGLNNPSGVASSSATFSSYALTLMTIGLFQSKGWLPNLQQDVGDSESFYWFKSKSGRILCNTSFKRMPEWKPKDVSIDEALLSWFKFWGDEFQYESELVNIKDGGIVARGRNGYSVPNTAAVSDDDVDDNQEPDVDSLEENPSWGLKCTGTEESSDAELKTDSISDADEQDGETTCLDDDKMPPLDMAEDEVNEFDLPAPDRYDDGMPHPDAEPSEWIGHPIVVVDPFIPTKNTAAMLVHRKVQDFRRECTNAHRMLQKGHSWIKVRFQSLRGCGCDHQGHDWAGVGLLFISPSLFARGYGDGDEVSLCT